MGARVKACYRARVEKHAPHYLPGAAAFSAQGIKSGPNRDSAMFLNLLVIPAWIP